MIKTYYMLTKPGIILGNLITMIAGFMLAAKGTVDFGLCIATLIGLTGVIASACVCNNYIDRMSDQKMKRTQNRPLAKGSISHYKALIFAFFLGISGIAILAIFTNLVATLIALSGFVIYVFLYSFFKYHTTLATLIGSISGAIPPVVGYAAVSHTLDKGGVLLFLILVLWQMPHFYAIALYRMEDYKRANIPVLPLVKGILATKVHMLLYIIAFIGALFLLTHYGYAGYKYLAVSLLLGFIWLILCLKGFKVSSHEKWARQMFVFSLITIMGISLSISLFPVLNN